LVLVGGIEDGLELLEVIDTLGMKLGFRLVDDLFNSVSPV
jgi:hypothetical protein